MFFVTFAHVSPRRKQTFEKHVKEVLASDEFKKKNQEAQGFFTGLKDFVFGRPTTLENAVSN